MNDLGSRVTKDHLRRQAYLYVRQSTYRQVNENQESTRRQYALSERAVALGWPAEAVVVIDSDLGRSGSSSADRPGFQRLVADVGMGRVGIVLGLEVSRLARSSADWARLLEICALADTLLLDEDGLYDPGNFNDRLLLGLKGTMSEAELHFLQARMRGGLLNKARRGELRTILPVGFVHAPDGQVVLDPDQQVQQSIRCFFATFRRTGSALATAREFHSQNLTFPKRLRSGPHKDELCWASLSKARALDVLRNPRYAGAFAFGRSRCRRTPSGQRRTSLPQDEWIALFPGSHPGYISWSDYQDNIRRLEDNRTASLEHPRPTPPREGTALLQGLVVCGRCGARMSVYYAKQKSRTVGQYACLGEYRAYGGPTCQWIPGTGVDVAVSALVVEAFTPLALEVALSVQQDLDTRAAEVDRLRRQQVDRMRYHAELAQRRYMNVDPENRLVAGQLEAEWNEALSTLRVAEEEYEVQRQADQLVLNQEQKTQILDLTTDFPRLWNDPRTQQRDRKRLLRLLVEDVTLLRGKEITAHVRFKSGAVRTLSLPLPVRGGWDGYQTPKALVQEIDRLLDDHPEAQVAEILNGKGLRSARQRPFTVNLLRHIERHYGLKTRYQRLRERGLLTVQEFADKCGAHRETVSRWYHQGRIKGHLCDGSRMCLLEPPEPELLQHKGCRSTSD